MLFESVVIQALFHISLFCLLNFVFVAVVVVVFVFMLMSIVLIFLSKHVSAPSVIFMTSLTMYGGVLFVVLLSQIVVLAIVVVVSVIIIVLVVVVVLMLLLPVICSCFLIEFFTQ